MVFSSLTFLFAFLPITAALYFLIPNRIWRNGVLLAASLLFYAWGEPVYILLLLLAALRRVQTSRRHAVGQQVVDLVLHQRDQR